MTGVMHDALLMSYIVQGVESTESIQVSSFISMPCDLAVDMHGLKSMVPLKRETGV